MQTAILRSRRLSAENAADAARWLASDLPLPPSLRNSADQLLGSMIGNESIKGVLIERLGENGATLELAGLGVSCFVAPTLFDTYLAGPRPFLFVDVLDQAQRDSSAVLNRAKIAKANAGDGLHLVVHYLQRGWDLTDPYWRSVGAAGHQTYVEHHRGYHLKRAVQQDWSSNAGIYRTAGYRDLADVAVDRSAMPPGAPVLCDTQTVFFADENQVKQSAPGSTMSYVFQHRRPRCFFTASEQRLLSRASEGGTDQQLADQFGLSLTTIKHTWQTIYQKASSNAPFVLGDDGLEAGKRGPEKRRHILTYVENHPEELRPYAKK